MKPSCSSPKSCAQGYGLQPGERAALIFHHSFGAARVSLLGAAASGATLRVYDARRVAPNELAHRLEGDRVSFVHCSPSLLRAMLSSLDAGHNLPALRLLATGADALGPNDVAHFRARVWSGCVLAHTYATSETGPIAAFFIGADTPIDGALVPIGDALPGKQSSSRIPTSAASARSSLAVSASRRDTCATPLIPPPASAKTAPGADWFCTGDRGRLRSDGVLEHHGRRQNVVKVRGFTVDRDEVERAVRTLDHVREATVRFEAEPRPRLVAYLVSDSDPPPTISAIRDGAQRTSRDTPRFRPRSSSSTACRATTVERSIARLSPGSNVASKRSPFHLSRPNGDLQHVIAQAFESVLGIAPVGSHDDFFELGGDSLAAAEVVTSIRATTGRELTTAAFSRRATSRHSARYWTAQAMTDC